LVNACRAAEVDVFTDDDRAEQPGGVLPAVALAFDVAVDGFLIAYTVGINTNEQRCSFCVIGFEGW